MNSLYEDRARPLQQFDDLIKEIVGDQTWKERAACKGLDVTLFYPERGVTSSAAKAICSTCEVQRDCMEFAFDNNEQHGIWGGLAIKDRRRAKRTTLTTEQDHTNEQQECFS